MIPVTTDRAANRLDAAAALWRSIPLPQLQAIVNTALKEDVGHGDITTRLVVDPTATARATLVVKSYGVVSGLPMAKMVLSTLDPQDLRWTAIAADGGDVQPGDTLARAEGQAAGILTGERLALNLIQRMSGIASLTREFVSAVAHTRAKILDTRKTAPGLRILDKYAVVCGGGHNHRFGLDDGILIKDNHIAAAGGVGRAVALARRSAPGGMKIEIEVDRVDLIGEALETGADILLLDNMSPQELREAVRMAAGRAYCEASGGVSLDTVVSIAESGVDYISVGRLTHSPQALDIGLELEAQG